MKEELVKIAEHYGYEAQSRQLIEEIADVEVMLEQVKWLLDCQDAVEYFKEEKIKRQLERMQNYE